MRGRPRKRLRQASAYDGLDLRERLQHDLSVTGQDEVVLQRPGGEAHEHVVAGALCEQPGARR